MVYSSHLQNTLQTLSSEGSQLITEMAGGAIHPTLQMITPGKVSGPPQDTQWVSEMTQS